MVGNQASPEAAPSAADVLIARSWQRSIALHHLDPDGAARPRVLPARAVREHREPMQPVLEVARSGLEELFRQVRDAGYIVLLTDAQGVAVDFINNPVIDRELRRAGLTVGGCWSEDQEGTCAVGMCAIDRLPITVHHGEHFLASNRKLTCSASPILTPEGQLLGILDASALRSPDDKRSQHLVLQMVDATARMIENACFLRRFERQWVLRISTRREFLEVATEGLVALDGAGRILAANQRLLHDLGQSAGDVTGRPIEEVFGIGFDELASAARVPDAQALALPVLSSGSRCFGLPRAPRATSPAAAARPALAAAPRPAGSLQALAGSDPRMGANVLQALQVLDKDIAVLLLGETGSGKDAFARAMHEASARAGAPFVAINCAAIPEALIESELFGYRQGAFTGARSKGARGKIAQAHGGTLFLDEIGDMPLALQARLLRVLAEREITPLGSETTVPVDVQLICATHRDLQDLVDAGAFRLDLYYRLAGISLRLPPLRERSDKRELIEAVLHGEAKALQREAPRLDATAVALLLGHHWPGNIRELKNVLRAALATHEGSVLGVEQLPAKLLGAARGALPPPRLSSIGMNEYPAPGAQHARSAEPPAGLTPGLAPGLAPECEALLAVLREHHWNIARVARALNTCRSTVYRRMARYGIVEPNRRS